MFEELSMVKIRVDRETKKLLVGQLSIATKLSKFNVLGFVSQLIVDEDTHDSLELKDYLKYDKDGVNKVLTSIGEAMSYFTRMRPEGGSVITEELFKLYIYQAMKIQQVCSDAVMENNPKTSKIWIVDMGEGTKAIVSAYSWNTAVRLYPVLKDKVAVSLVKYDIDVDTMATIDSLIRANPWSLIMTDDKLVFKSTVLNTELYVPEEWGVPTIHLPEELLKEQDIRIVKRYNKKFTDKLQCK